VCCAVSTFFKFEAILSHFKHFYAILRVLHHFYAYTVVSKSVTISHRGYNKGKMKPRNPDIGAAETYYVVQLSGILAI